MNPLPTPPDAPPPPQPAAPGSAAGPEVDVVIPAYNVEPFLAECVDSVLAQTLRPRRILITDDGSTDQSGRIADDYQRRHPELVTVIHQPNAGLASARNAAIRHPDARAELIAILDSDDVWLPRKLERQAAAMTARPQAVLSHTGSELFGADAGDGPMAHDVRLRIDGTCFQALFERNGIVASAAMFRRSALPPGPFEPTQRYAEDYDLWLRLLVDRPAVYLPEVLLRYRRHASQMTFDGARRVQIWPARARLRCLDLVGDRLPPDRLRDYRRRALEILRDKTYSRYWNRDYEVAAKGFEFLGHYGQSVPLRHRLIAALGRRLKRSGR